MARVLGGSCSMPLAAFAMRGDDGRFTLRAALGDAAVGAALEVAIGHEGPRVAARPLMMASETAALADVADAEAMGAAWPPPCWPRAARATCRRPAAGRVTPRAAHRAGRASAAQARRGSTTGRARVAARALPLIEILPAPDAARVARAGPGRGLAPRAGAGVRQPQRGARVLRRRGVRGRRPRARGPRTRGPRPPGRHGGRACASAACRRRASSRRPPTRRNSIPRPLWSVVAGWPWARRPVWLVRGNGGRDWLGQQLRTPGPTCACVQSYGRAAPTLSADDARCSPGVAEPARWIWMFSSSEAIDHLSRPRAGAAGAPPRAGLASAHRRAGPALASARWRSCRRRRGGGRGRAETPAAEPWPVWRARIARAPAGVAPRRCGVVATMNRVTDDPHASMNTPPPMAVLPPTTPTCPRSCAPSPPTPRSWLLLGCDRGRRVRRDVGRRLRVGLAYPAARKSLEQELVRRQRTSQDDATEARCWPSRRSTACATSTASWACSMSASPSRSCSAPRWKT